MNVTAKKYYEMLAKPDKQVNKILKIAKYNFQWGRKAIFEYCVKTLPVLAEKNGYEEARKNYSTTRLFAMMDKREKSLVIQRLEKMEKNNIENFYKIKT